MKPQFVSISNIFIDDIVLPDGKSKFFTIGGAGTHATIGMRVWSKEVGIVASIGKDYEREVISKIRSIGANTNGIIIKHGCRTTRAWQLYDIDDTRIEVMRVDYVGYPNFFPTYEEIPEDYRMALGFHIHLNCSLSHLIDIVVNLKKNNSNCIIIWEPTEVQIENWGSDISQMLKLIDVFSPNIQEAERMTKETDCIKAAEAIRKLGSKIIAIRMGGMGSVVLNDRGEYWQIPAIVMKKIDVTGAGNSYCGGFIIGYINTLSAELGGLYGAVSASFTLEQFGIPDCLDALDKEAKARLNKAQKLLVKL